MCKATKTKQSVLYGILREYWKKHIIYKHCTVQQIPQYYSH